MLKIGLSLKMELLQLHLRPALFIIWSTPYPPEVYALRFGVILCVVLTAGLLSCDDSGLMVTVPSMGLISRVSLLILRLGLVGGVTPVLIPVIIIAMACLLFSRSFLRFCDSRCINIFPLREFSVLFLRITMGS